MYKPASFLRILLPFLPAIAIAYFIFKYGVNIPFWDQWGITPNLLIEDSKGQLTFQTLFAQANESRLFFPKLVFLELAKLTQWNTRAEMAITWLLALLVFANLYFLVCRTLKQLPAWGKTTVLLLMGLVVFSPMQFENWLWGIQMIVFVPILCISTCITLCYLGLRPWQKFLLCGLLCTISTFSYANGMVAWVVVYPIMVISTTWTLRSLFKPRWLLPGWLFLMAANLSLYFHNYQKPSYHPSFSYALTHPLEAIRYFLVFMGIPLGLLSSINFSLLMGLLLISLFAYCNWRIFRLIACRQNDLSFSLGWQVLGTYSLLSGLITASGRVGFGVSQAMSSRYTTFSIYLIVSLIGLVSILLTSQPLLIKSGHSSKPPPLKAKEYERFLILGGVILFLVVYGYTYRHSLNMIYSWGHLDRLNGKSCLLLINQVLDENCIATRSFPFPPNAVKPSIETIDQLGYVSPGLITTNVMEAVNGGAVTSLAPNNYGHFDTLERQGDSYIARGWAILPARPAPADAVVLAYKDPSTGQSVGFAITEQRIGRTDVAKELQTRQFHLSGWEETLDQTVLPESACDITAWAMDANQGEVFQIAGSHNICD